MGDRCLTAEERANSIGCDQRTIRCYINALDLTEKFSTSGYGSSRHILQNKLFCIPKVIGGMCYE